ncbi:MAG: hypothetical protein ACXVA9_02760 [Bdellovibrionales bacterium]
MEARLSTGLEDPLYRIFEEHLHSGMYDALPADHFVRDVVDFYWKTMSFDGHVPHAMKETLKTDLSQEVQEMLKTKIYGHFGIGEYNRIRRSKSA